MCIYIYIYIKIYIYIIAMISSRLVCVVEVLALCLRPVG